MQTFRQSPTDPAFVQNPYPAYARARAMGDLVFWEDYGLVAAVSHRAVFTALRDRRMGRQVPPERAEPVPQHLEPFYRIERHSMLELEPPEHTRLRGLVLRAFTSRRIGALEPQIAALAERLIDDFPDGPFDLLPAFAEVIPVVVIARLLGVPEEMGPQLLAWSHAMVAMYQARRDEAIEHAAARAAAEFAAFVREFAERRRKEPRDDLISHLLAVEAEGERLTMDELVSTAILLLNAGHEATVHAISNGVKALLETGTAADFLADPEAGSEEILRFDPPLHLFTRWIYEPLEFFGHRFERGDRIALVLGAACRDPALCEDPDRFSPLRGNPAHTAFGGGPHFCVGAPLARLEMQAALPVLLKRCPNLRLTEPPVYADRYHFHGLERLMVRAG